MTWGDRGSAAAEWPLYFLHIPKTAGTSLTALLDARVAPEEIFPGLLLGQLLGRTPAELRRFRLYRGHLGLLPPLLLGWRVRIVTVLRDPVERALSHYAHARQDPAHYLHGRVNAPGYGLADFLGDPLCRTLVTNAQARWLGLDPAAADGFEPPVDPGYPYRREAAFDLLPLDGQEERIERLALATLERALVVGVTERLPETAQALAGRLGWPRPPEPRRLNVSPGRPRVEHLDAADRDRLLELNAVDARLYREAGRRLDASMTEVGRGRAGVRASTGLRRPPAGGPGGR